MWHHKGNLCYNGQPGPILYSLQMCTTEHWKAKKLQRDLLF